ncbi:MAG: hypothetical protein P9L94_12440 [Candidatus Hinthialibacter antarcticus]|nr:hypothetical protein [Candidatus Hinthialibacter antarcticus]
MIRYFSMIVIALLLAAPQLSNSATNNTGNNPCFLVLQVASNANVFWAQDGIDIGVDVGADGSYEYWLSEDTSVTGLWTTTKGVSDFDAESPSADNWRTIIINLEQYAGEEARIQIRDNNTQDYIAINAIRLNNADGVTIPNGVPNGFFEDASLAGWSVASGDMTAADLITENAGAAPYGSGYLSTSNAGTVVLESDVFALEPVNSFIYGTYAGPVSSRWDIEGLNGSDNGAYVYVDVGTDSADPDGEFTAGTDVPLYGYFWQNADGAHEVFVINTSGLEGRRAQFVAVDNSESHAISLDAIRMNYDHSVIVNGGFEDGFEGGVVPEGFDGTSVRPLTTHPSGGLPGWTINNFGDDPEAVFTYFAGPGGDFSRSDFVWVGSGNFVDGANDQGLQFGIELRSDVFVIQPVPAADSSVFLSFNSAQVSNRIDSAPDPADPDDMGVFSTIQMQVDVDSNGAFEDADDFVYRNQNQGMSWNREQRGELDEWHFPEYRMYIDEAHQGLTARLYIADLQTGGWGWMGVDDFYFWDGDSADLAFPNSDFEEGTLNNWVEDSEIMNFDSWLSATPDNVGGDALHNVLNDVISWVDGNYAVDSNQSGDGNVGELTSEPFTIPSLQTSPVPNWSVY